MKQLSLTPEIESIARRVLWFEDPRQAITDTARFLAYAMTYGSFADVAVIRQHLSDDEVRAALASAPPGIFDPRSWAYWNLMLDRQPTPPMPERTIEGQLGAKPSEQAVN